MNAAELEKIRYRSRMGYPGSLGRASKFEQAKGDVARLVIEVVNLQRFVGQLLAPVPGTVVKTAHVATGAIGGTDDDRDQDAARGAGDQDRGSDRASGRDEDLIARAVETRIAHVERALHGDAPMPTPGRRPGQARQSGTGWQAAGTGKPGVHLSAQHAARAKRGVIADAGKLGKGLTRTALARKYGVSHATVHRYLAEAGVKARVGGPERRHYDDEYKRTLVIKAAVMDPGARQVFLHNEGINKNQYYKLVSWVKAHPA